MLRIKYDQLEESNFGSPTLELKTYFERGHGYKGYYLMLDTASERFYNNSGVNHLKISKLLKKDISIALDLLPKLEKSDDELADQFVGHMWEGIGIKDIAEAENLSTRLKVYWVLGRSIIFINIKDLILLKMYLMAYSDWYHWSKIDWQGEPTREPDYKLERYFRINKFLKNLILWIEIEKKGIEYCVPIRY